MLIVNEPIINEEPRHPVSHELVLSLDKYMLEIGQLGDNELFVSLRENGGNFNHCGGNM